MSKQEIIIVSGLQRSGTSMLMQMLEAGGVSVLYNNEARQTDEYNPKGYYEHEFTRQPKMLPELLEEAVGKAIKLYAVLLPQLSGAYNYKIIFIERDLRQVLVSLRRRNNQAHLQGNDGNIITQVITKYERIIRRVKKWMSQQSNIEVLYLNYHQTLAQPLETATSIVQFLNSPVEDITKMVSIVNPALHHVNNLKKAINSARSPIEVVDVIERYTEGKVFCEIGIGEGDNLNKVSNASVKLGVDNALYSIFSCKEKYPNLDIRYGSILDLLPQLDFEVCYMWLTYPLNEEVVTAILDKNDQTIIVMGLTYYYHLDESDPKNQFYTKIYKKRAEAGMWNQRAKQHITQLINSGYNVNIEQIQDSETFEIFSIAVVQKG